MNEVYNLERQTALENRIDPTGKKWVIKGNRESALVHARPDPDRVDAQIPKEFEGQWTSPSVLTEKIDTWLGRMWDKSDAAANKARLRAHALLNEVEEAKKVTPQESLDALSDEIKEELGLDLRTEDERIADEEAEAARADLGITKEQAHVDTKEKPAAKATAGRKTKANKNNK
jgi:hypothetical protein